MAHVFHELYFHITWATHSRDPLIHRSWRPEMLVILGEEASKRGGWVVRHNAMPDHVHLLVRLPPNLLIADFVGEVKGATAFRVNRQLSPKFKLRWQEGYGIISVRKGELAKVSRYIEDQEEHHRKGKLSKLLETIEIVEPDWPPHRGSPLKGARSVRGSVTQR